MTNSDITPNFTLKIKEENMPSGAKDSILISKKIPDKRKQIMFKINACIVF